MTHLSFVTTAAIAVLIMLIVVAIVLGAAMIWEARETKDLPEFLRERRIANGIE